MPLSATSAPAPKVQLVALSDGNIRVEGVEHGDVPGLRAELQSLSARRPKPNLIWTVQPGIDFKHLVHAIMLVQDTGVFPKMAFVLKAPQR